MITESIEQVSESTTTTVSDNDTNHGVKNDDVDNIFIQHPLVPPTLPVNLWPNQNVYLQAGIQTNVITTTNVMNTNNNKNNTEQLQQQQRQLDQPLPLGIPIDFETSLFRGQFLVRLKSHTTDTYFDHRKRIMQFVIQGTFIKSIPMNQLYIGSVFRKVWKYPPPQMFETLMYTLFQRIAPGTIMDFHSIRPHILSLYGGAAKMIRIDPLGTTTDIPDITSIQLEESLHLLDEQYDAVTERLQKEQDEMKNSKRFRRPKKVMDKYMLSLLQKRPSEWTIIERKKVLSNPTTASYYSYNTNCIHTIEIYDESTDYGKYEIQLPMFGRFNFSTHIGIQPMTYTAMTVVDGVVDDDTNNNNKNNNDTTKKVSFKSLLGSQRTNEIVYEFVLWNTSVIERLQQEEKELQEKKLQKEQQQHSTKRGILLWKK